MIPSVEGRRRGRRFLRRLRPFVVQAMAKTETAALIRRARRRQWIAFAMAVVALGVMVLTLVGCGDASGNLDAGALARRGLIPAGLVGAAAFVADAGVAVSDASAAPPDAVASDAARVPPSCPDLGFVPVSGDRCSGRCWTCHGLATSPLPPPGGCVSMTPVEKIVCVRDCSQCQAVAP